MVVGQVDLPMDAMRVLCAKYYVTELAVFGSVLREDFRVDSDIDLLVEYDPTAHISLLDHIGLKHDLEDLLGRKVDLVTKGGLKKMIRGRILESARTLYHAA